MKVSEIIRQDPTYKKSKKQLTSIMSYIDIDMLIQELSSLHSSRASPKLKTQVVIRDSVHEIVNSSVDEIATRSRCTTIKLTVLQAKLKVESLHKHLSKYLLSKHAVSLKKAGDTTITAQRATVDVYLRLFIEARDSLENLMKLVDIVLEDIDQTSFGLSRIKDAIELAAKDR